MLIDTHAHIDFFEKPDKIIEEYLSAGVSKVITPGVEPSKFELIKNLSIQNDSVYIAPGIHPTDANTFDDVAEQKITELLKCKKTVAVGEIGLDYYEGKEDKDLQIKVFEMQLEIAKSFDLPVIIHDREAHLDTFNTLKKFNIKRAVMHCFSGSSEFAKECIKEGWMIGVGGIVTFKNAKKLKETVYEIPLENILLETDCPFLAPHPFRGQENSPKYLPFIAKEIANIKDIMYDEVAEITTNNALNFFNIKEN